MPHTARRLFRSASSLSLTNYGRIISHSPSAVNGLTAVFQKKVRHCELKFYGTLYRPHIDVFREEGVFLKEIPSRVRWRIVRGLPRQRDGRSFVWIQRTADIGNKLTKIKATPSVSLRSTASRAVETALGQEMARPMCHFQVRKRSKPHLGFAKKALSHPHGRSQEGHRFPCF